MALDLADYDRRARDAVKVFWKSREKAREKQAYTGLPDQGERASVTGGKNLDGFIDLVVDLVKANGLPRASIHQEVALLTLPGYFRPTKRWDLLGTGTEWRRPATLSGRGRVIRFCLAGLVSAVAVSCSEEPTTAPARDQSIAGQIAFVQSTTGDSVDRAALEALWTATDGAAWFTKTNWLTDAPLGDWYGVRVDNNGRVVVLLLPNNGLVGELPPEIGDLDRLRELWLFSNDISGEIPPEIGNLANAVEISLEGNRLSGSIPSQIGNLAQLRGLLLTDNELTGPVPSAVGELSQLTSWGLGNNRLTGVLPNSLLRLEQMDTFHWYGQQSLCASGSVQFASWLQGIQFWAGSRCNQADLNVLTSLYFGTEGASWTNRRGWLEGAAPGGWQGVEVDSLGRVTSLDLASNGLAGELPADLSQLKQLTRLRIGGNALSGRLPVSLSALSLRELDYAGTELCAPVEEAFRKWAEGVASYTGTGVDCAPLTDRDVLALLYSATRGGHWSNATGWLTDAPLAEWYGVGVDDLGRVSALSLSNNGLDGALPAEIGGLSSLQRLELNGNRLSELLPTELGSLSSLTHLDLDSNGLTGTIPPSLGQLTNLVTLRLSDNRFTGALPEALGNISGLVELSAAWNNLEGQIPAALSALSSLSDVWLRGNRLEGPIPASIGDLSNLRVLVLNDNNLGGTIPPSLGQLSGLELLSLERNQLAGRIPPEFGGLSRLRELFLADNRLTGVVPAELSRVEGLRVLDVSRNREMAGALPADLADLGDLSTFLAGGTNLCAPADESFLDWLSRIEQRRVAECRSGASAVVLTQAVQSRRFPVPLVAGKKALLRVFVTSASGGETTPPVRATFHRAGAEPHVVELPARPVAPAEEVDEGDLGASSNAEIPGEVVQPGLEMVVEIDPEGTLDASAGVARRIPEEGRLAVEVERMPLFHLTVIPFVWSEEPDSSVLKVVEEMAADPGGHDLLWASRTLLPVEDIDVTAHEPVLSSSNDGRALLRETEAMRVLEGAEGHYLGMMAGRVVGARGAALRPGRTSFSVADSRTLVRLFGYNMGLHNAPCGGAWPVDPAFPQVDGSIGSWGYDFRDGGRVVSHRTPDMMSRCSPAWISGFHFSAAISNRLSDEPGAASVDVGPSPTLLLWGGVDEDGALVLEPVFVANAPPAPPRTPGPYQIAGLTEDGDTLFFERFDMTEVVDSDGGSTSVFAFALPARRAWASALASVALSGPEGSSVLEGNDHPSMTIVREAGTGRIRAMLRGGLQEARTLDRLTGFRSARSLELLFTRGVPEPEAWGH